MTKKLTISLLALMLVLAMFVGLVGCSDDYGSIPFELKLGADDSVKRMPGDKTATELQKNPDRGFSVDLYITLDKSGQNFKETLAFPVVCDHKTHTKDGNIIKTGLFMQEQLERYKEYAPQVATLTVFLTNFKEDELSDSAITQLYNMLRELRNKNLAVIVKFAYQHGDKEVKPSIDIIEKHMAKLGEWMSNNSTVLKNIVSAFRMSFIGEDGDFVNSGYTAANEKRVINAFNKMIPAGKFYTQAPSVVAKNSSDEYSKLISMGFFNNNMDNAPNAYTSGGTKKNADAYKQYVYQSEANYNSFGVASRADIDGKAVLKQVRDGYFTTFDLSSMYVANDGKGALIDTWKATNITKKDLDSMNLPYYDEWFMNSDGTSANRSVFDYLRDFLGYNLSITNLKFTKETRKINGVNKLCTNISFVLTNYGMAAPLNIGNFELCIKNNSTGNFIKEGSKLTFPSTYDPKLLVSGGQIEFHQLVVGDIDRAEGQNVDPTKGHSLGIRVYQKRSSKDLYVRLSNDVPFDGKVNWIYSTETKTNK